MRLASVISVAVAVILGLMAAFLARGLLPGGDDERRGASARTIVVASQAIGFGAPLTAENLREVPWPAETALEGSFANVADLSRDGRRLSLMIMQRNEPVLASKVTGPNQRATLSTQIDEGMRAVSVRVDEVRGVAGFVLPGDRVDVILTRGESGAQEAAAYADVLLQNVKVLAIDQLANERQDKPAVARAVTLQLGVQEAQKVILAQGVGRLSLVLRQAGEADTSPARRVVANELGEGVSVAGSDRVSELERRLDQLKNGVDQSSAQAGQGALQRLSEMETRLRDEIARSGASKAPSASAPSASAVVNVVRNGNKRDQYTVALER